MILTHCPICGLAWAEARESEELRTSFDICECCGCEYGHDDTPAYRTQWLNAGGQWFEPQKRPKDWNMQLQLQNVQEDWNS